MSGYEEKLKNGEALPLVQSDVDLIKNVVNGVLDGTEVLDKEYVDVINALESEIKYVYKDEPSALTKFWSQLKLTE